MDDDTLLNLAAEAGEAIKGRGLMLTLAESCTGGMAAQFVTAIPGSSNWFERGFVAYSNAAKTELLGVLPDTLERHGAVSEPTVLEMALGALANSQADLSLSISGIAGPEGGLPAKPVGTVCFGWAFQGGSGSETRHFRGDRTEVRRQATAYALQKLAQLTLDADL